VKPSPASAETRRAPADGYSRRRALEDAAADVRRDGAVDRHIVCLDHIS
jgi:hypothetical protein